MQVTWRNKEYTFEPRTLTAGKDKPRESDISANIYAFDTESVSLLDRYEPQCFQISNSTGGESLTYLDPYAKGLEKFLDYFVKYFSWMEFENRAAFMYGHNLIYDWLQLIKYYPDLISMARTGIGLPHDYEIYKKDYFVILRKGGLFTGNAPHFTLKIGVSSREWVNLKFRDTFSFFPTSLAKLGKQLKFDTEKLERQSDLGKRDFRIEADSDDKKYFEEYAKKDALITRMVAESIRELHINAEMQRIRVSAPGFAINYLLHSIPEETEICTGTNEKNVMQLILDTYSGGRTGGVFHGKVENISVLDFHSSYPASMVSLPSFGKSMQYITHPDPGSITEEELLEIISECHCFIRLSGTETDGKYPAIVTNRSGKLTPIYGDFTNIATTGVEAYVGIKSGTLKVKEVLELVCLVELEPPEILPFKMFAEAAYTRKQTAEKGSPEYNSAKLVLNSAYGKLIESRNETTVADDVKNLILPYIQGMEVDFGKIYYEEYIKTLNAEADKSFDEIYPDLVEKIFKTFPDDEFKNASFGRLSLTKLDYGRYAIPAAASLITATSRARLLAVMKATNALYWDTDSVFIKDYDEATIDKKLSIASKWLPGYIVPLRMGEALGDLDCEIKGASGYLAGTKRYYLKSPDGKIKRAVHGIPTAPYDKAGEMIELLATGQNNIYQGRERPKSVKETKDVKEIGRFSSKQYESQFHLDDRLQWTETENGWEGSVKEYVE
jgi:hypothetical protein